jgi:hypothetical protein
MVGARLEDCTEWLAQGLRIAPKVGARLEDHAEWLA